MLTCGLAKAKEDASEFLQQKIALEKEKKALNDSALEKEAVLKQKVASIGYVMRGFAPAARYRGLIADFIFG
jgi:seryl-tRNA synthetase